MSKFILTFFIGAISGIFLRGTEEHPQFIIAPDWKYSGYLKVHDELYQHEFVSAAGSHHYVFQTDSIITVKIKP